MLYNSWYVKGGDAVRRCVLPAVGPAPAHVRRFPRRGKAAAVRGCPSLRAGSGTCTAPGAALKAFDRKKMDCDYY